MTLDRIPIPDLQGRLGTCPLEQEEARLLRRSSSRSYDIRDAKLFRRILEEGRASSSAPARREKPSSKKHDAQGQAEVAS